MHIFFGKNMNYFDLRKKIEEQFKQNGIDELADINWIMVEVLGIKRSMLPFVKEISGKDQEKIMSAVQKRVKHIPLDYIFGKSYFYGYEFKVDRNVLIPRQDTEILVENIVKDIKSKNKPVKVLDIGTGSGAIIVTIKKETNAECYAVDVSKKALEIAKYNAEQNNAKVEFIESNLFENVPKIKFDYIVSNPPYIESDVISTLQAEVRLNEPILALDGGVDGLDFYRKIINQSTDYLTSSGKIYFEIGYNQAEIVKNLLENDYSQIQVYKDYGGNDRVIVAQIKK